MNRVATATVIRGTGECEVYLNDVVNKEIAKMNEQHKLELTKIDEELKATKKHRDKLLADRLAVIKADREERPSLFTKVRENLENAWCVTYGMFFGANEKFRKTVKNWDLWRQDSEDDDER